ncbi:MAG: TonB-dependent receptor [Reichenbachiella sp.]
MKFSGLIAFMLFSASLYAQKKDSLDLVKLKEVVVSSTRANEKTPMTFSEISKEQIKENNMGKDMPYILEMTPSAVTTSDAGAGVGYTGIRIRGSDATRVNITLNGIPYNDSESQGTFWVNMPDFASSVSSIQVQRGVGTSTNGAGAFGASVNIETGGLKKDPYAELDNAFGSFNTRKHTLMVGSGLINNRFAFDARVSQINSDGYLDRASSDLSSYFLSGGYYGENALIKINVFSGHEKTYQAWYGTPESRVNNDVEGMNDYIARNWLSDEEADNLLNSGRTYNYYTYDNEVDNYQQDHYQIITAFDFTDALTLNFSFHLTHGEGYFEQYKEDEDFADYNLDEIVIGGETVSSTDLIRRRWLNNNFYGTTFSLDYKPSKSFSVTLGGAANEYDGDHYGEIIWARFASNSEIRERYYENNGLKKDFNIFMKADWQLNDQWFFYGDVQFRKINYTLFGLDNDQSFFNESHDFEFFNPKAGLRYQLDENSSIYASYAVGNKEPSRSDFTDNTEDTTPKSERLHDIEAGYQINTSDLSISINGYYMLYDDQLVLTGDLNDVGSSLRTNVDKSYRRGIELQAGYKISDLFEVNVSASFSENKIEDFQEYIYNSGEFWEISPAQRDTINYSNTDIAYSPNVVSTGSLIITPMEGLKFNWIHKYVGQQYLDNTQTSSRSIDAYYVSDIIANYTMKVKGFKSIGLRLGVYNVFNKFYSANGYTWGYRGGQADGGGVNETRENFYYPQAGTNFMLGLNLKF